MKCPHINHDRHPMTNHDFVERCRAALATDGVVVLPGFVLAEVIETVVADSLPRAADAYYANATHNVYLTPSDPLRPANDPVNRQVVSTKGLIADDQIPNDSPLRSLYNDPELQHFLCQVLEIEALYPYADDVSSINVHFAAEGMELGWHFDNSSFAVTLLLQTPEAGGEFQYVPDIRSDDADHVDDAVVGVLDGETPVRTLPFGAGDLVLFRGRNALHRVTPTKGAVTRVLVVFAYNDEPGIALSDSALQTFYGRSAAS